MNDWLENAQEEWWNGLTDEEKERERAEAIMEDRRCEELEEMAKAHREAEYLAYEMTGEISEISTYDQLAQNQITLDGEQHPEPNPDWDEIPF